MIPTAFEASNLTTSIRSDNLLRLTYDMRPYGKKSRMDGTDTRIIAQSTGTETCLLYGAKCTGTINPPIRLLS